MGDGVHPIVVSKCDPNFAVMSGLNANTDSALVFTLHKNRARETLNVSSISFMFRMITETPSVMAQLAKSPKVTVSSIRQQFVREYGEFPTDVQFRWQPAMGLGEYSPPPPNDTNLNGKDYSAIRGLRDSMAIEGHKLFRAKFLENTNNVKAVPDWDTSHFSSAVIRQRSLIRKWNEEKHKHAGLGVIDYVLFSPTLTIESTADPREYPVSFSNEDIKKLFCDIRDKVRLYSYDTIS